MDQEQLNQMNKDLINHLVETGDVSKEAGDAYYKKKRALRAERREQERNKEKNKKNSGKNGFSRYEGKRSRPVPVSRGASPALKKLGKVLLGILIFALLAMTGIYFFLRSSYKKTNYVKDETVEVHMEEVDEEPELTSEVVFDPAEVKPVSEEQRLGTYSLLLIGSDRRDKTWYGNSDTMIVANINYDKKTINMLSFMRDLYAQIPGVGVRKLNNAFAVGGGPLLVETLESNYGVSIDGYVTVDFDSLAEIIDIVGGVDVLVDGEEAQYMNIAANNGDAGETTHLNGEQAVAYSRIRYVGNSDWERTSRQREVLNSLANQLRSLGATEVVGVINKILPLLTHNLKQSKVMELIPQVPELMKYEILPDRVPFDGLYYIDNEILVPDMQATVARIQDELYGS